MKSTIPYLLLLSLMFTGNLFALQGSEQNNEQAEETKTDWSKWNGTHEVASAQFGGRALPAETLETMRLTIADGKFTLAAMGMTEKGQLHLPEKPEGKPAPLDIKIEDGANKGKTVQAIFKFEGDKLFVCYAVSEARPTEFASTADPPTLLIEYKKAKK